jgi:hypothetical protein
MTIDVPKQVSTPVVESTDLKSVKERLYKKNTNESHMIRMYSASQFEQNKIRKETKTMT